MVYGVHHVTCAFCRKDFVCGDCIDMICPECREKERKDKEKRELRKIELEDEEE